MCPRVLGELAGVIARLLLIILEMPGQTRSSLEVEKDQHCPHFQFGQEGACRELQAGQPPLSPWQGDGANSFH